MSLSVPRRKVAALAVASAGLAAVLSGAFAPAASAAAAPGASGAKASSWFKDPRTAAQRKAEIAVPKNPQKYQGKVVETRAVYRTKAGALAVPMRYAFGNKVAKGQAVTLDGNGLFVVNTTVLTASAKAQIRQLAVALDHASSVRCEGYADYAGAAKRNNVLARDRAARVCDFLVSVNQGLTATTVGYGPTWPAVVGGDSEARKLNRRVVIEMTGAKPAGPVAPQAKVPGPPILEHVNGYQGTAYFAWSKPADDGGSPITGYQVTTGGGWSPVNMQLPRAARKTLCRGDCGDYLYGYVDGLTAGSSVDLRVRAVNAIGAGAPSNTLSTVVYDVPGAPTGLDYVTDGLDLAVHFGAPATSGGLPVTGYQISFDGGLTYDDLELSGTGPWTVVEHGVAIGETYAVRVRAGNDHGWGEPAAVEVLVTAKPSAPVLGEHDLDGTTLTFAFNVPAAGGLTITSYEATLDGGETWQVVEPFAAEGGTPTFSVGGLTYGTTYDVRLRAVNARGKGPWSNQVSALVATVPDAPTGVVASPDGATVTVTFAAPEFDGGSEITGWEVAVDDDDFAPVVLSGNAPLTVTLTGQTPGTHVYAVRAVNVVGRGDAASTEPVEVADLQPNPPVFSGGWTWAGHYEVSFQDGEWNGVPWTGYELSVNNGPWLPLTVTYGGPSGYTATAEDPGCASTGGSCGSTTGRVRVVTATGASEPSNVAPIYLD